MSNDVQEKTQAQIDLENFFKIEDIQGKLLYTTSEEELTEVLVSILTAGIYVKTFTLFGGKVELTYTSIAEKDRMAGYELMRLYTDKNKEISEIQMQAYNSKVNIALQLVRVKTGSGNTTNLTQGSLEERIVLLTELGEEMVRLTSKYLMIFANITSKAFNSEDVIKN
jgi:hypothetical protein